MAILETENAGRKPVKDQLCLNHDICSQACGAEVGGTGWRGKQDMGSTSHASLNIFKELDAFDGVILIWTDDWDKRKEGQPTV